MRPRLAATRAVLAAALAAVSSPVAAAASNRLVGTVGPGFDIALRTATGKLAAKLSPGAYVLVVHDRSKIHDFHLSGPGINRVVTGVAFVGSKTIRGRAPGLDPLANLRKAELRKPRRRCAAGTR